MSDRETVWAAYIATGIYACISWYWYRAGIREARNTPDETTSHSSVEE